MIASFRLRQIFWTLTLAALLAACAPASSPAAPANTQAPTATTALAATATAVATATNAATATTAPAPTVADTATPLPNLPSGPFKWSGKTRPLLMAHYMPWYQNKAIGGEWGYHWTMNYFVPKQNADGSWTNFASHYTPLIGLYDSSDETVLEYQAQTMKLSGIDGVIVDWYGIEDFWDYGQINKNTLKLFQAIKKAGLKFAICYEDQTVGHMVDNGHLKAEDGLAHGQKVMAWLQNTWFKDDAYLKVGSKPVLFTFGPQYFKQDSDWQTLFSGLNPKPAFVTLDNHPVDGQAASYPWPPMSESKNGVLPVDAMLSYMDSFYGKIQSFGWTLSVGGAFPGFHDIYKEANVGPGYGYLDALDGKTFRATLQLALDKKPDMIQLITWNDYGEGTNIEPTVEFGTRYLEMVQEARAVTGGGDFKYTKADLSLPLSLYQERVKHYGDAAASAQLDQAAQAILAGKLDAARTILEKFK